MKRHALVTGILGGLLILILLTGAAWLLGTTSGARFLLQQITAQSGGTLTFGTVQGRLLDEVRINTVTLQNSAVEISLQSLRLRWQPAMLLTGTLAVGDLQLQNAAIHDRRPPSTEPLTIRWPTLPSPLNRMSGWISSVTVSNLVFQREAAPPVAISRLTARINLHRGRLAATNLEITTPGGTVTGAAAMGFRQPELDLYADVRPTTMPAGLSRLLIHTSLKPGSGTELAAGTLRAVITRDRQRFELATPLSLAAKSIALPALSLTETGRNGALRGSLTLGFQQQEPDLNLTLQADQLDLSPELPFRTPLNGTITVTGTTGAFRGAFGLKLSGTGAQAVEVAGVLTGDHHQLALELRRSNWLGGTLTGSLSAVWQEGLSLNGSLQGRNLDPGRLSPDWPGVVNLEVNGTVKKRAAAPLHAQLTGTLLASRLRGRPLTGTLAARMVEGNFHLEQLFLNGKGFTLKASGTLDRGISLGLHATDLSGLVPGARGNLQLNGLLQRRGRHFDGTLSGTGSGLGMNPLQIGAVSLTAALTTDPNRTAHLTLSAGNVSSGRFHADAVRINADGTIAAHRLNLHLTGSGATLNTSVQGRYATKTWNGTITTLDGRDRTGPWRMTQPAAVTVNARGAALSRLVLAGSAGEQIQAKGIWYRSPVGISLDADWQQLNLVRIGQWLPELQLTGTSSGTLSLAAAQGALPRLTGTVRAGGTLMLAGQRIQVRAADITVKTAGDALRVSAMLDAAELGSGAATLQATLARGFAPPVRSTFSGQLNGANLALLRGRLPEGVAVSGTLDVQTEGELLPGGALRLTARAAMGPGVISRKDTNGELRADLREATLTIDWRDERLNGTMALELTERGRLSGTFRLPLPARLATALQPTGTVAASLSGTVREQGLVTALLPGLVQESRGDVTLDAHVGGTWQSPQLSGSLNLSQAGFSLPVAGIRISDVQLTARLAGEQILIDSLSARSGPGTLSGSGSILLRNWRPVSYQGTLRGDRFQFIYLPELQATGSPRLDLSGTPDKLTVRGSILIPDLVVADDRTPAPVRPSTDVIIIDAPRKKSADLPFALDAQIRVQFGERVFVRTAGIDARMDGTVDLTARSLTDISGKGVLTVAKGSYKTYGVNLAISRGRLIFSGGPVNRPNLDIFASRTVGEVTAGVMIVGNLPRPIIRLYSEPALSESDIMGYIVLGQPLSGDQTKINAVMQAAGLLLSASQTAGLNDQIIGKFGIDSIGVETDKADISQSIVTVGKYLTPKLFISYGRSLFSPANYLKARYTFSERWELETMTGTESSIDLYYKINFN